jgi:perosamine synthetase
VIDDISMLKRPRFRIYINAKEYIWFLFRLFTRKLGNDASLILLESSLHTKFQSKYSILVPQARVGIYLTIKSLVTTERNKIVLSPYTIADVINMVICAGGIPVFADIDRASCNITPESSAPHIDDFTAAVMITHLHGITAHCDEFKTLCDEKGIFLIEDAAQAFGAMINGKSVGTFGDAGIFSFGRYKNISSFFGGAVITSNLKLEQNIKNEINKFQFIDANKLTKRTIGCLIKSIMSSSLVFSFFTFPLIKLAKTYDLKFILKNLETELDLSLVKIFPDKYKEKMLPVQAELVSDALYDVDKNNLVRIEHARIYNEYLFGCNDLVTPNFTDDGSDVYTCYPIQYKHREKLVEHLYKCGFDIGIQHIKNCADLSSFKEYYMDCENARIAANEVIMLPTYPLYGKDNVVSLSQAIKIFLGE